MRPIRHGTGLLLLATLILAGCPGGGGGSPDGGHGGGTDGGPGGGGTDGGVDRSTWPPGLGAIVDGLPTLTKGGTLDLGDGQTTITTTVNGGDRTEVVSQNGTDVLTIDLPASGPATASGDLNGDGTQDYTYEDQVQGAVDTEVETWDTNFDGTADYRVKTVLDTVANTVTVDESTFDTASKTWASKSTYTGSASMGADPHVACSGMAGFPSDTGGAAVLPLGEPNIRIVTNKTPGACTDAQARRISNAMRNMLVEALPCLDSSNPVLATKLVNAIVGFRLTIGCGNTCTLANTDLRSNWRGLFGMQRMNLETTLPKSDTDLESLLLHEMLHWAGQAHVGGDDGDGGHDLVYSCSRYCMGCSTSNYQLGGGNQAWDCAGCKDPATKADCGTMTVYEPAACTTAALCHAALNGNAACTQCLGTIDENCDGTLQGSSTATFECCSACPAGYDSNDMPCGANASVGAVSQQCGKPPSCP